jgi:thermostable 8-oxoguanine DNA glycosylase
MIDPTKVTNFERSQVELEEFLLFAIVVAGKSAFQQAKKLEDFLANKGDMTPFEYIRWLDGNNPEYIDRMLRQVKMGQYNRISMAFRAVAYFFATEDDFLNDGSPLKTVPVRLLESVKGIGMKTARFFIMHSRPDMHVACLDTHVLQWLGERGHEVPKTTPQGHKYLALEKIFLDYANKLDTYPAVLDLEIWNERSKKVKTLI